jgi:hypothetical protein
MAATATVVTSHARFVNDTEYLWTPTSDADAAADNGDNNDSSNRSRHYGSWMEALHARWGLVDGDNDDARTTIRTPFCPQCVGLPINGGDELPGETLVTDFESDLFVGTLLLRIRNSHGTVRDEHHRLSDRGYFYGLNRRYQVVIRGKFKTAIPWTECFTGFQYVYIIVT